MLQANPQILPLLLQQIAQADPQLSQTIGSNPEQFMQLLNNPAAAAALLGGMQGQTEDDGQGQGQGQGQQSQQSSQPRVQQIQVTQEEKQSIDNLERLGFPRNKAIEAFFICDKNEELAANYLFDQANQEHE